ncbi:MAG TPA: hypothetical protein VGL62_07620 [Vicinamibacterales bacterium]|jgi:hypothetical protein
MPHRVVLFVAIAVLNLGAGCGGSAAGPSAASTAAGSAPSCDASLWTHVYEPSRLTVLNPCLTVTGTIENAPHVSDDGDLDFHFVPDAPFQNLLNSNSNGHLHVEAICQGPIQSDTPQASQSCGAYKNSVAIAPPGTHASVTGPYVLDTNHGWTEIHPVTSIVPIR